MFSRQQLKRAANLTEEDLKQISNCRRPYNRLGFAYQVAFVRLLNRFTRQQPFEIVEELASFNAAQLGFDVRLLELYRKRQPTISEHQETITRYLGLRHFGDAEALLHTTGKLPYQSSTVTTQFNLFQNLRHAPARFILGNMIQARHVEKILPSADVFVKTRILGQVADARLYLEGFAGGIKSADGYATGCRLGQPNEHQDRGGLSGAIGTEETEDLTFLDGEV